MGVHSPGAEQQEQGGAEPPAVSALGEQPGNTNLEILCDCQLKPALKYFSICPSHLLVISYLSVFLFFCFLICRFHVSVFSLPVPGAQTACEALHRAILFSLQS